MSKHSRYLKSLEIINNIDEECSEFSEDELSESEVDSIEQHDDSFDTTDECESTGKESEDENILNIHRGQKRKRLLSSSESESDVEDRCTEIAADGTIWQEIQEGSTPGRAPIYNIFREVVGPTAFAKRNIMKGKMRTAFSLLTDNRVMEHIRKCTEEEASRVLGVKWNLTPAKINAFIALLYARGAYQANNLNISYLWNKKWGPAFFSNTMSRSAFCEIMRFIRFDKKSQRSQRLQTDKFALISDIWYKFIENSQNCYKPGEHVTIDEQLFPTKARCRFTQYMPNKPDKFGIKFWLASDVSTKYVINGFPYLGKDENRGTSSTLGEFVVLKLLEPFTGCGRSVTTDNFFTSASLAAKLLEKRTTIVGTIRSNKRELPKFAKQAKDGMPRFSTKLYKSSHCSLTIYKSKPNKKVLLLSSKHTSISIEKNGKRIPETIRFYNSTKYGVDMTDQMARKYSVKSKSQRWPAQIFFNILDLAGINSWVLYRETTGEKISRQQFLFQLAEELAEDFQHELQKEKEIIQQTSTNSSSNSRKRCEIGFCKENKTTKICFKCNKYVCGKCAFENPIICKICGI